MRRYSGEALCEKHFSLSIEERVIKFLRRSVKGEERYGLAVSGGRDSMCLFWISVKGAKRVPSAPVPIFIDEGIKGYSEVSSSLASEMAEKNGRKLKRFSFEEEWDLSIDEIAKDPSRRREICYYCEILKRRALESLSRDLGIKILALGSTANDVAGSILMSVIRGELKERAMKECLPRIVKMVRPLSRIPDGEMELYARINGVEHSKAICPYFKESLKGTISSFLSSIENKDPGKIFSLESFWKRVKWLLRGEFEVKRCEICGFPALGRLCDFCELVVDLKGERKASMIAGRWKFES